MQDDNRWGFIWGLITGGTIAGGIDVIAKQVFLGYCVFWVAALALIITLAVSRRKRA